MKTVKISVCILCILLLCSCTGRSEKGIYELTYLLNQNGDFNICAEDYRVTRENDMYKYCVPVNEGLLCVYTDRNGIAVQCTLTVVKENNLFRKNCISLSEALTGCNTDECDRLVKLAFAEGRTDNGQYNFVLISNTVGTTFLVNRSDCEINTNGLPTLKREIRKEDISRPTAEVEKTAYSKTN